MYQVAMRFWNEIAASQPLGQPWATLFRLEFEELSKAMDRLVYRPAEQAGADHKTQLAFGLVAPLLLENEAISAYLDETDQGWLRAAMPEVNLVEEAVHIAQLECRLDHEQSECLARLLDAALLESQRIGEHSNEGESAPAD